MKRADLSKMLIEADRKSVWAFTPATFGALLGRVEPNYLKLMMKRLTDQGVLVRAARGVYVNPQARSLPFDIRRAGWKASCRKRARFRKSPPRSPA